MRQSGSKVRKKFEGSKRSWFDSSRFGVELRRAVHDMRDSGSARSPFDRLTVHEIGISESVQDPRKNSLLRFEIDQRRVRDTVE